MSQREHHILHDLHETALLAREKEAADMLKQAKVMLADYSSAKHGAARALVEINEREKAARQKVA